MPTCEFCKRVQGSLCKKCKKRNVCENCLCDVFMLDANGTYEKVCKVCFSGGLSWMLGELQKSENERKD